MNELGHYMLAMDYAIGFCDDQVSEAELAVIYSILPEVLLDIQSGEIDFIK